MKQPVQNYDTMLQDFKRSANMMISGHMPGHLKAAQTLVNASLTKEHAKLKRWFDGLKAGLISIDDFIRLYGSLRDVFTLKGLKERGVPQETSSAVRLIIHKLFRAMMIISSGAAEAEFNQQIPNP